MVFTVTALPANRLYPDTEGAFSPIDISRYLIVNCLTGNYSLASDPVNKTVPFTEPDCLW